MLTKTAARWMDKYERLSPDNQKRIINSGIVNSRARMLSGLRHGRENMMSRTAYTEVDIEGLTPQEYDRARKTVEDALVDAYIRKDKYAIQRHREVLDAFDRISSKVNPQAKANTRRPRSVFNSAIQPSLNIAYTANADRIDPFIMELIRTHEAFETLSTEKNKRRLAKSPDKYRQKAYKAGLAYADRLSDEIDKERAKQGLPPLTIGERGRRKRRMAANVNMGGCRGLGDGPSRLTELSGTPAAQAALHCRYATDTPGVFVDSGGEIIGSHADIDVLVRERKLVARNPYMQQGHVDAFIKQFRQPEYDIMDAGAGYDPATAKERFGKKDASNLKRNMQNPITVNGVTYQKEF